MNVNKTITLIITNSGTIHSGTTEMIKNEKKSTIMTSLNEIITYNAIEFKVNFVMGSLNASENP